MSPVTTSARTSTHVGVARRQPIDPLLTMKVRRGPTHAGLRLATRESGEVRPWRRCLLLLRDADAPAGRRTRWSSNGDTDRARPDARGRREQTDPGASYSPADAKT